MIECEKCDAENGKFCSPMHLAVFYWIEADLFDSTFRCQWCGCTLYKGYHEKDCPARPTMERIRKQFAAWMAEGSSDEGKVDAKD